MFESIKRSRGRRLRDTTTALILSGMLFSGAVALVAPSTASAGGASNTFTFKGAYSGTLNSHPRPLTAPTARPTAARGSS